MSAHNPLRWPGDRRLPRLAGPSALVLFGFTGDLARRKLLPALYDLTARGLLPPSFSIIGFGRRDWDRDQLHSYVREAVEKGARTEFNEQTWAQLAAGLRFVRGDLGDEASFERLAQTVQQVDDERGTNGNHAYYLSIPPDQFPRTMELLSQSGLASSDNGAWRRVAIEKPFGHDLESAKELDDVISTVFPPEAVFRVDHYLGKETVQNLLAVRFANEMFEPLWNANHVDHVQITMAEDIGIGSRAGYFEGIGSARDVIQNHLLQLLALTAMEEPVSFDADSLHIEKLKVLRAVSLPRDFEKGTSRGQYGHGWQGGEEVKAYVEEDGIEPPSSTETYAAMRLEVGTRRWAGVPFYLRAGKRLGRRVTEIAVVFDRAPKLPFDLGGTRQLGANALVIRVQPDEGVTIRFGAKVPGTAMEVRDVTMDFGYGHAFTEDSPEAYERLLLDILLGDPPLFPQQDEVQESWRILDPIIEHWHSGNASAIETYAPGSWGPPSADRMLALDGRGWRRP